MPLKASLRKLWPLLVVLPIYAFIYYALDRSHRVHDRAFRQASIRGQLLYCEKTNHGFWIRFRLTDNSVYTFAPVLAGGQVVAASAFLATATPGDSIRKQRLVDTLVLVKGHRLIKYPLTHAY